MSNVGIGYALCPICYKKHDETVLIARSLSRNIPRSSFTGFELCDEHKATKDEYLALVAVLNENIGANLKPQEAKPAGDFALLRRTVVPRIFDMTIPPSLSFVYCEPAVIEKLKEMLGKDQDK